MYVVEIAQNIPVDDLLDVQLIEIVNQSTAASDADLEKIAAVLQIQVDRDYAPAWNYGGATIRFVPRGEQIDPQAWVVYVMDNSPQPGALGFHEDAGKPVGRVFAADDKKYRAHLSVTLSHELIEMLGDPYTQLTVYRQSENRLYCFENCDAVESDGLGYEIDGILVSDFVLPSWFVDGSGAPYDFRSHCAKPFQVLSEGYIGYMDLGNNCQWGDLTTNGENVGERKPAGSRYWRRRNLYGHVQA